MKPIRVLIVDDSALVRLVLTEVLSADPEIEVVGAAADAFVARDMIKEFEPDVLTLDIEMPKMDGITFLKNLMRLRPMPVVMVSALTKNGAKVTLDCLEAGAVDFLTKPKLDDSTNMDEYGRTVAEKIKGAAKANVKPKPASAPPPTRPALPPSDPLAQSQPLRPGQTVVAIAASTGGTEAIRQVIEGLPGDSPPVLIAQHIPKTFSSAFAERVDRASQLSVAEAVHGQEIFHGHAYIAPGDQHLVIARKGSRYFCNLTAAPPVNRHRPSCDTLFFSVAQVMGTKAVGVIMTGMGADGANGLLEMQVQGAATIAQDEATSVVWGMPGVAVSLGAADRVLPLEHIAHRINQLTAAGSGTRAQPTTTAR